ncbi:MAG: alkaline phosphatase family protein [Bacteroidia bacterium]|nr:alkaline phosphatase family protein [Bacteroidia bacterium]
MRNIFKLLLVCLLLAGCKPVLEVTNNVDLANNFESDFVISFGSCDDQKKQNNLWDDVLLNKPDIWIWGGDNIYSDTKDMNKMAKDYEDQLSDEGYKSVYESIEIHGTWDDHDYGLNDGGSEYKMKKESQQLLLNFLGVDKSDERYKREGVYYSKDIKLPEGTIKLIVLDMRYFRTALKKSKVKGKRYEPTTEKGSTILGEAQWKWFTKELKNSQAEFNIIVSSIQVLSSEHGYESWGTMPNEQSKLFSLIQDSKAKGVIVLSGDRHISEFSKKNLEDLKYPLIDFTSSGLTHSYSNFSGEPNPYREGEVVFTKSFGLVKFNFKTKKVLMQMKGNENKMLKQLLVTY